MAAPIRKRLPGVYTAAAGQVERHTCERPTEWSSDVDRNGDLASPISSPCTSSVLSTARCGRRRWCRRRTRAGADREGCNPLGYASVALSVRAEELFPDFDQLIDALC